MATEVKLPDLGEGIDSGGVLEVLVKEGDRIEKNQGILEIETDKATVEVPSPTTGVVKQIHVSSGQTIQVGALLLTVEAAAAETPSQPKTPSDDKPQQPTKGEAKPDAIPDAKPASKPAAKSTAKSDAEAAAPGKAKAAAPPDDEDEEAEGTSDEQTNGPPVPPPKGRRSAPSPEGSRVTTSTRRAAKDDDRGPIAAGPAVRRFAREVGIDLATVRGSGDGGRITREDVLEVVRRASRAAQESSAAGDEIQTPGSPTFDDWGPISIEDAPRIRQTIAAKMHQSWSTVPRVTNFDDADVTELERIRKVNKADYAAKGIKLTAMPFLIKAVSMALRRHALINASYDMENKQTIYKRYVNVGIAVDTPRGLMVPVLRNADDLSISDAAKELAQLSERARSGQIQLDELRGGTFTISNLGAIGGTYSTPIVNVPEVAILLIGRSRKMPIVMENDEIAVRLLMPLSLSYDHRLVDGATAARFLNDVIGYLEEPGRLLLAP